MKHGFIAAFSGLLIAIGAVPAKAQPPAEPRLSVSVGPDWIGRMDLGGRDATLTANPGGTFPLFTVESTLRGGMGASGALGLRVARGLWLELTGRYHSARLTSRVTGDWEANDETAREAIQQIVIQGGGMWMPAPWRLGSAVRFFVSGGAGHVRQLHASQTLAETGRAYYAGGGAVVSLPQRRGGTFKASGLRIDLRATALERGVAFDERLHVAPGIWAALFLRF
ncbi:MAG: hypothetical protein AB7N65_10025 [Vicinamibacterales bacterium]